MKNLLLTTTLLTCIFSLSFAQQTFYTTGLSGDWSQANAWTLIPDGTEAAGSPSAEDHVVISHYITHFASPGYMHHGNITVRPQGTYEMISGLEERGPYIFGGEQFDIEGTIITISDLIVLNETSSHPTTVHFQPSSMIHINGNLILDGRVEAVMDNKSCGSGQTSQDLWFKTPEATVCGEGTFIVPNRIRAWDTEGNEIEPTSAGIQKIRAHICEGFTFYASSEDCEKNIPFLTGLGIQPETVITPELKIFPNPATGSKVSVDLAGFKPDAEIGFSIRNLLGQPMSSINLRADINGRVRYQMSLNLQPGTYVIVANSYDNTATSNLQIFQ